MSNKDVTTSFENYCRMIRDFSSCMNDYLYVYDMVDDSYCISEKALKRFKVPAEIFHNVIETHLTFVYPKDQKLLGQDLEKMVSGEKDYHNIDYRWIGRDGNPIWINCRGRVIKEGNVPRFLVGCVNEIGETQKADNNSGLLSSATAKEMFDGFYRLCPEGFIVRIGIEDFSEISEKYGIEYGDFVVKNVAGCISECLVPGQEVYRAQNDEFIICDYLGGAREDVELLLGKIRKHITDFIESIAYKVVFTVAGGVLLKCPVPTAGYKEIMKLSYFSLYEAKRLGRHQCYFFRIDDYEAFLEKQRILTELSRSISHGFKGFSLFFQPIIREDGDATIYAAEGLLRYKDSEGLIIPPSTFIPILEESGLIIPVGKFVLREAAKTCKEVREKIPEFKVSVNLSYIQIMKSPILEEIFSEIKRYELDADSLIIEMTESGYLDATPAIQKAWSDLKEHGVLIAVDDFGTGYSNLQSISKMSPNIVKVDREFTSKALKQEFEKHLMASIVELVHSLDLQICVEGIETKEELEIIKKLNPDYIQGYFYGKPCDKENVFANFVNK